MVVERIFERCQCGDRVDQSVDSEDTRSALTVGDGFLVPQNMHKLKFYMKRIIGDDGPFFYDEEFLNDQKCP